MEQLAAQAWPHLPCWCLGVDWRLWVPCAAMPGSAVLVVGCCCGPVAACSDVGMQSDNSWWQYWLRQRHAAGSMPLD